MDLLLATSSLIDAFFFELFAAIDVRQLALVRAVPLLSPTTGVFISLATLGFDLTHGFAIFLNWSVGNR